MCEWRARNRPDRPGRRLSHSFSGPAFGGDAAYSPPRGTLHEEEARMRAIGVVLVVGLMVAGCGDTGTGAVTGTGSATAAGAGTATATGSAAATASGSATSPAAPT